MPWKDGYTISDERSSTGPLQWPGGARCALNIVVNMSVAATGDGTTARDLASHDALFTLHDGLDALLDALERHRFKATFAVPAIVAAAFPQRIQRIASRGHEIAAHGLENEDVGRLSREEERRRLRTTRQILTEVAGNAPCGWFSLPRPEDPFAVGTISSATMPLLIEEGFEYMGNSLADDVPHYWVTDFARRDAILAMPYYYHFDDQFFMMFPSKGSGLENPDFWFRNLRLEFQAQHRRGRFLEMTLHPKNVGFSNRMKRLDDLFMLMREGDVWNATSLQCARHWRATYPAETTLKLRPSIWQDHEGSLS